MQAHMHAYGIKEHWNSTFFCACEVWSNLLHIHKVYANDDPMWKIEG